MGWWYCWLRAAQAAFDVAGAHLLCDTNIATNSGVPIRGGGMAGVRVTNRINRALAKYSGGVIMAKMTKWMAPFAFDGPT